VRNPVVHLTFPEFRMIRTAIPALLLTLSLAACSSPETDEQTAAAEQSQAAASEAATPPAAEPAPAELAGSCDDTQAQWIIGKTPTEKDIEQAKSDSKSDAMRSLKPGDAATMDFNPNRLNIILDEKGAVASVNCG
jgi:hypothetical protein